MKYFAYGSNMSLRRLTRRAPSAKRLGLCILKQHSLRFHKVSHRDGSAKCDAFFTGQPQDFIVGSLFVIAERDKAALDEVEGLGKGYQQKIVHVHNAQQQLSEAFTYYATDIDDKLLPYSWYLNHVIQGAKEIGVPLDYLNTPCITDANQARDAAERAIYQIE